MKNFKGLLLGIGAAAFLSGAALAADAPVRKAPPPPAAATPLWDLAFGAALMSDYNFRGVSQSNREISFGAYAELQFNPAGMGQFYAGVAGWRINWPSTPAFGFTNPSAEIDFTAGWRNTWGAFTLDLGFIYYYYPNEVFNGFTNDSDFWEIYAKPSFAVTPDLTLGATVFYTPDLLHYSLALGGPKASAVYAAFTGKWVTPWKSGDLGAYLSGELGYWSINTTGFPTDPSYAYGNIGLAFTYKIATLDLRYHGNSMSAATCQSFLLIGPGNPATQWCGSAFIATLKFDTTMSALSAK